MRVIVCGGRDYTNRNHVFRWLDMLFAPVYPMDADGAGGTWLPRPDLVIIQGGARGVDRMARDWAVVNWVTEEEYLADWDKHGKAAGPIRNKQMIDEGKPNVVVAFPGGKGTADMIKQAKSHKITIIEIPDDGIEVL